MADADAPFRTTVEVDGSCVRLRLFGDLDMAGAATLQRAIDAAFAHHPRDIVVELRALRFLDLTGMRALHAARAEAERHGCRLRLGPGPAPVMRVFEMTGTTHLPDWSADPFPAGRFTRRRVRGPGDGLAITRARLRD